MPTIIDSLIMTLGLDTKGYDTSRKQVDKGLNDTGKTADENAKKLKGVGKEGTNSFDTMAKSAVKFLALLGSSFAVKQFIQQTVESNAALERFSRAIGESAENILAWRNATELAGGTAGDFDSALKLISQAQTGMKLGEMPQGMTAWQQLGVDIGAFGAKAKPGIEVMRDLAVKAKAFAEANGAPQTMNMLERMGFTPGMAQLLIKGGDAIDEIT